MHTSMACGTGCPLFDDCVSYALEELQMARVSLKPEQRSIMEAIYNSHNVLA